MPGTLVRVLGLIGGLHQRTDGDVGALRAVTETFDHHQDRAFGWPLEMVLRAAAAGWRVGEAPVSYGPRAGGRSKVSGSARGSMRAARDMSRVLRELG